MEPLARLDSKSILSEEIFLEIFDQEDEISKGPDDSFSYRSCWRAWRKKEV